jgi:penicillin-binding protein 2
MRGRGWGDSHRSGHGWTDARKSIADSVNTYYYRLALDMGVERYDAYMKKYGFGEPTGIDLMGEIGGIVPSPAAKLKLNKERWYPGDLVNSAIGQGMWKATPLQLARGTAALADHGMLRRPHLVTAQRGGFDSPWKPMPQPAPVRITDHPENLRVVQEGMEMTINGPGGTARRVAVGAPYRMAGKTGTAQVVNRSAYAVDPRSLPMHKRHRALFIAYAPAENPTIAIAVAVEGGGFGAATAGPIARKVFDAWLLGKMPELPELPKTPETEKTDAASSPSPIGRGVGVRVGDEGNAGTRVEPAAPALETVNPPAAGSRITTPAPLPQEEGLEPQERRR